MNPALEKNKASNKKAEVKKDILHKVVKNQAKYVKKPTTPKGEGKTEMKNPSGAHPFEGHPTHSSHTQHMQHVDPTGTHIHTIHEEAVHIPHGGDPMYGNIDNENASGKHTMPHKKYKNLTPKK